MLMTSGLVADRAPDEIGGASRILGMQKIVSLIYAGADVTPLLERADAARRSR